jgi:hypothetical protein
MGNLRHAGGMGMKHWLLATAFLSVLSAGPVLSAPFGELAVGDLTRTPIPHDDWTATAFSGADRRLGLTFFDFRPENEIRRDAYDLDLKLLTLPVLLDWRPFRDSFHVSTGIIVNATHVSLDGRTDVVPAAAATRELGAVHGEMQFNPVVPYLGFGWATTFGKDKRWGFTSDFGVAFLGTPRVSLQANGPLASDPAFRRELAQEEDNLEDDLSDFKLYPIVSISLFYRF